MLKFLRFFFKKKFKLILNKKDSLFLFNSKFMFLLIKIYFFIKKKSFKRYTFIFFNDINIKINLYIINKKYDILYKIFYDIF